MVFLGVVARMLHNAFADGERQIEPAKSRIALFKPGDNAQRVEIVVEAESMIAERAVERFFAGVAKRGMPDVVRQSQRLCQFLIKSQSRCRCARDLSHLERMRQAAAEMIR